MFLERFAAGHGVNPDPEKPSLYVVSLSICSVVTCGLSNGLVEVAHTPGVPL